jgi:integrase
MADRRSYGTGSLIARKDGNGGETWYGKWRANGRQVMRKIGPVRIAGTRDGLTKTMAEAKLRAMMGETPALAPVAARLTLSDVAPRYLAYLKARGRKRSTLVAAESCLRVWLLPAFGDKAMDAIRSEDVEDLMARMEAGHRPGDLRRMKPCGPKTIRNYITTLSAIYRVGMHGRRGWATRNPCDDVDLPEVEGNEDIRFLEPVEVQALAAAAVEGDYQALDRAFYVVAAMSGLRHGELLALRWRDVDWPAMRIRVRQNFVLGEYGTPKSRRSTRSVPMAPEVGGELDRLFKAARRQGDDDLVFADPFTGAPLSKAANNRRFRRALRAARLDETHRIHDLRHTFGTRMAAVGTPMRTLQEWMGHRDIEDDAAVRGLRAERAGGRADRRGVRQRLLARRQRNDRAVEIHVKRATTAISVAIAVATPWTLAHRTAPRPTSRAWRATST